MCIYENPSIIITEWPSLQTKHISSVTDMFFPRRSFCKTSQKYYEGITEQEFIIFKLI